MTTLYKNQSEVKTLNENSNNKNEVEKMKSESQLIEDIKEFKDNFKLLYDPDKEEFLIKVDIQEICYGVVQDEEFKRQVIYEHAELNENLEKYIYQYLDEDYVTELFINSFLDIIDHTDDVKYNRKYFLNLLKQILMYNDFLSDVKNISIMKSKRDLPIVNNYIRNCSKLKEKRLRFNKIKYFFNTDNNHFYQVYCDVINIIFDYVEELLKNELKAYTEEKYPADRSNIKIIFD